MTSVVRNLSQIGDRIGYFLTVGLSRTTQYTFADESAVTTTSPVTEQSLPSGTLLKDMGKFVTVVNSTSGLYEALYRKVQLVDGTETEGVPANYNTSAGVFYVKVWDSAGTGVSVVRTG